MHYSFGRSFKSKVIPLGATTLTMVGIVMMFELAAYLQSSPSLQQFQTIAHPTIVLLAIITTQMARLWNKNNMRKLGGAITILGYIASVLGIGATVTCPYTSSPGCYTDFEPNLIILLMGIGLLLLGFYTDMNNK